MINSSNTKTYFSEKILEKFKYLARILIFSISNKAIWAFLVGCINIKHSFKEVIYIIKALTFSSNATLANSFILISFTYLVVKKALVVV